MGRMKAKGGWKKSKARPSGPDHPRVTSERPSVDVWVDENLSQAPKVFGFVLALGRIWRLLGEMGVSWDVAVRAVRITDTVWCGLPTALHCDPEVEGLTDIARAALRRLLPAHDAEKKAILHAWIPQGMAELQRRMQGWSKQEMGIEMNAMQVFADLVHGAKETAALDGGMPFETMLGLTEVHFDEGGWPEAFRLNPKVEVDIDLEALANHPAPLVRVAVRDALGQ